MPTAGEALDALWEDLAGALHEAGPDAARQRLYLAKLVLLLARELDDPARVRALAARALRDLD
jgi:hypothetical protein